MSDFAESCGFPRWAKPDPYIDDPDFDDDFVVSDVCQKVKSTKSKTTKNLLAIYAPYMLLCHCANPACAEEIVQFEKKHGGIRYFPKAFVVNGVPRTRFGEIKIPFSSQRSWAHGMLCEPSAPGSCFTTVWRWTFQMGKYRREKSVHVVSSPGFEGKFWSSTIPPSPIARRNVTGRSPNR